MKLQDLNLEESSFEVIFVEGTPEVTYVYLEDTYRIETDGHIVNVANLDCGDKCTLDINTVEKEIAYHYHNSTWEEFICSLIGVHLD